LECTEGSNFVIVPGSGWETIDISKPIPIWPVGLRQGRGSPKVEEEGTRGKWEKD